jgi:hypothetical protein
MHPSDSSTQRNIESLAIDLLNGQLDCALKKGRIPMNESGTVIEVDGYDPDQNILCEVYCGIDGMKAGQTKKVITDAFKLILFEKVKQRECQKLLLFIDDGVMRKFEHSKSWYSMAFEVFGIKTITVQIPEDIKENLRQVKKNQSR